jgi:nitrogen regulatory protein P-II 1
MKLLVAIVEPYLLPDIKKALYEAQVYKLTVTNALGCGQEPAYQETYRGVAKEVYLIKKIRLEVAVSEDFLDSAIEAIQSTVQQSSSDGGKIFVYDLVDCIRIRTGERGSKAVM